jgi:hypothetical protein
MAKKQAQIAAKQQRYVELIQRRFGGLVMQQSVARDVTPR